MFVLGIDPATHCGWAVIDMALRIKSAGTWDLTGGRFEGGGMRYVKMRAMLAKVFAAYPEIQLVGFEEVRRHMGVSSAHVYGGLVAVITAFCEERKTPYVGIPVGTVKKRATGSGNADKSAMILAARGHWPSLSEDIDDNTADAAWIAVCARELHA